jgi:glucose/mannose-6-phosphate isomerase
MSKLDDASYIDEVDAEGFLRVVEQFSEQIPDAFQSAKRSGVRPAEPIDGIAVLGVGGSGISGDVLRAIFGPEFPLPVQVCKGYELPGWVGARTLVFAVSYSGETEETLEGFEKARSAGARIVTITTGGTLGKLGEMYGCPAVKPAGGLQPRAALGSLVFSMLGICQRLGLGDFEAEVDETARLLRHRAREWGRNIPSERNLAKGLAEELVGCLPVIYGSEGLAGVAAYRWKCQLNECGKVNAYWNEFSELNHNEVMGWTSGAAMCPQGVVVLRHRGEHPRIAERIKVTLSLIGDRPRLVRQVLAEGESRTARIMDLIHLGDYVATYLAIARGVDPCRIDLIERVKRELPPVT